MFLASYTLSHTLASLIFCYFFLFLLVFSPRFYFYAIPSEVSGHYLNYEPPLPPVLEWSGFLNAFCWT